MERAVVSSTTGRKNHQEKREISYISNLSLQNHAIERAFVSSTTGNKNQQEKEKFLTDKKETLGLRKGLKIRRNNGQKEEFYSKVERI